LAKTCPSRTADGARWGCWGQEKDMLGMFTAHTR
jgi:hypothetical protein